MREIADEIAEWLAVGRRVALARVVDVEGSGPRGPGAAMAVNDIGEVAGSVSGGCVEGAVVSEALDILSGDQPSRVVTFGYSDDEAFAVGLTCGGSIRLFIAPLDEFFAPLAHRLRDHQPVALATVIDGPNAGASMLVIPGEPRQGSLGHPELDRVVVRDALAELEAARSSVRNYGPNGETTPEDLADSVTIRVFVESHAAPPQMWIFGAVDFTAALARAAKLLGYRVTVCDARGVFATAKRFPEADEVIVEWPHRYLAGTPVDGRTVICVLTHDPKFDVPLLEAALRTDAAYIGAMGSRRTHDDRLARLREEGVPEAALARLASPIGLDIGARTPEETAVSIAAEIISARWGGSGRRLTRTDGPIHRDPSPPG